ncbi:MAG: HlyD family efflux transporter periplasmic adaptor subunit [Gammaproteobacteria bacterium]|nr:HlyD family efflux transporter periplasmic adaptor subunit [Gammaproteobacteria bacterium]
MATHPLFRQEALDHATGRLDGQVLLAAPLGSWCALAVITMLLLMGTWFATTASHARKEPARGWLVPEGGLARVFANGDGFVTALMASQGDQVDAGQPLARIGSPSQTPNAHHVAPLPLPSHPSLDLVRAPFDGRVEAVRVRVGQYVPHGATVAVLAPGDDLVAEIFLPSHALGLVEAGQRLRLRYDALHTGDHDAQEGVVTHVSSAPLLPEEAGNGRIPLTKPAFPIRVSLPAQQVSVGGRSVPLRAGMLLSAEVAGPPQTLFESIYQTPR